MTVFDPENKKRFLLPVRVYYEDTDAGGVVYYANYLRYAERARSEFLRTILGRGEGHLWQKDDPLFVARRLEADYTAPARLDDLLLVSAEVAHIGGASLTMNQTVTRQGFPLFATKVTLVAVTQAGEVMRLPTLWREKLTAYL
ncbi:MAG: YbgC/FadM family acyl-CoA thioesterase [Alphaproteobacteria bacterium]|nr:YbgC/FadM family acyl-CoA thioesterase [Alphaproteobacteria bacterium]